MTIGIVGYGVVGKAVGKLFGYSAENPKVHVYDKGLAGLSEPRNKAAIQSCDLVFVAVPTPKAPDGSCDLSAVEEVVSWVNPPMCLKSTVPPGTVERLVRSTGKQICFSPEYVGETRWHAWKDIASHGFVIVGGEGPVTALAVRAYEEILGPEVHYYATDAKAAELCKYMENAFLATKVAFVNQFYDLAEGFGVDFNELRELWLASASGGRTLSSRRSGGIGEGAFPRTWRRLSRQQSPWVAPLRLRQPTDSTMKFASGPTGRERGVGGSPDNFKVYLTRLGGFSTSSPHSNRLQFSGGAAWTGVDF